MTPFFDGGASRRGAGASLKLALLVAAALLTMLALRRVPASASDADAQPASQETTRADSTLARLLLVEVRGASDVLCATVERAFNTGSWGYSSAFIQFEELSRDAVELSNWIGKRRIDANALSVARTGLQDGDACVRRVAAHIAGHLAIDDLHDRLRSELASSSSAVRAAALRALGHRSDPRALTAIRAHLDDAERNVRLAAIWALGSIESSEAVGVLLPLLNDADAIVRAAALWALGSIEAASASHAIVTVLQQDRDPEVRRMAAWALGRLENK